MYNLHKEPEIAYDEIYNILVVKDSNDKIHYFSSDEKMEQKLKELEYKIDSIAAKLDK